MLHIGIIKINLTMLLQKMMANSIKMLKCLENMQQSCNVLAVYGRCCCV